jgi:hypothetical protein
MFNKTILFLTTAIISATAQAQLGQKCTVLGPDPSNPENYNQTLATGSFNLNDGESGTIDVGCITVTLSKSQNGFLQIATAIPKNKNLFALAVAQTTLITLIDGNNKLMVYCSEK